MELLVLTVFSTLVDTAELGLIVIFLKKVCLSTYLKGGVTKIERNPLSDG